MMSQPGIAKTKHGVIGFKFKVLNRSFSLPGWVSIIAWQGSDILNFQDGNENFLSEMTEKNEDLIY